MSIKKIGLWVAFVSLFVYLIVFQLIAIWPFTLDDVYITLRYAQHWASGAGLLWNIGAAPVEGYSNFLYVAMAALFLKMGIDPIVGLKLLGIVGLCFTMKGVYCLSRFWFAPGLSLLSVFWLLIYRDEIIWVSSGLETTCYQAMVVFSVVLVLKLLSYQKAPLISSRYVAWSFLGVLLALTSYTRPEGAIWGAFILGLAGLYQWDQHTRFSLAKGWWFAVLTFLMCVGPYFFWRWQYYGLLMPNSVYCKGFATSYFLSLDKDYLQFAWPFLLLGLFAQWLTRDKRLIFLWLPNILYLLLLMRADPVSAFYQRLFLPIIPLLFPLALLGIQVLIKKVMPYDAFHSHHQRLSLFFLVLACCFAEIAIPLPSLQSLRTFTQFPQEGAALRMEVVQWLKQHVQQSDRVVLADSGLIPYYVQAQFDDSYCLNNRWMAKQPFDKMFDRYCLRILSEKPQVIILSSLRVGLNNKIYYSPADECFNHYLPQLLDYKKERTFSTAGHGRHYRYEVYALRADKSPVHKKEE